MSNSKRWILKNPVRSTISRTKRKHYKRKTFKVIRHHSISEQWDEELYFQRLLILYLLWREEHESMENNLFKTKFERVRGQISLTISLYEPFNNEVKKCS